NELPGHDDPDFTLLQQYVDALHRGGKPTRDAILAQRPDFAPLLDCLDGLDHLAMPTEHEEHDGPVTLPLPPPRQEQPPTISEPRRGGQFGKYQLEEELGRGGMGVV